MLLSNFVYCFSTKGLAFYLKAHATCNLPTFRSVRVVAVYSALEGSHLKIEDKAGFKVACSRCRRMSFYMSCLIEYNGLCM